MRVPVVVGLVCLALAQVKLAELASTADRTEATNGQSQLLRKMRLSRQRLPPPPVRADLRALRAVETRWLENQQLDHFDPTNNQTWRQRYFSNSELYKEGGPIFIFIEGESAANSIWITEDGSYMYSLANIFKAKMYILEHRYFGRSEPTLDISTDNLRWLTADQALADLAYFIEYLIANGEMNRGQKLAVFGGSYAGNLAAWARLKYPHLIHAAVSSSAPVKAQLDFPEYFEVVTKAMRTLSGEERATNLERAFKRIQTLLKTTDGVTKIQDLFYMCKAPDMNNKLDMDLFYETLSGPFATATQYNREYSYDAYSIKAQCNYMLGDNLSDDDLVSKLAKVFYDSMGFIWNCVDFDFASNMEDLKSSDYIDGDRQWFYMTCTSFGYYQTPNGDTVFPKGFFDVDYFLQICKEAFGPEFDNAMAGRGISRSNIGFGATSPGVENVIFVNGGVDPWHTLGVLEDVNERSPAVFIPGTSHCYDMYPNSFTDSDELVQAREKIKTFLQGALYEAPNGKSPTLSPFNF